MLNLLEFLKDVAVMLRRNARPVVRHINAHTVGLQLSRITAFEMDALFRLAPLPVIGPRGYGDPPEWRRELECIVQQIGKNVLQFQAVKIKRLQGFAGKKFDCGTTRCEGDLPLRNDFGHALVYVPELLMDFELS